MPVRTLDPNKRLGPSVASCYGDLQLLTYVRDSSHDIVNPHRRLCSRNEGIQNANMLPFVLGLRILYFGGGGSYGASMVGSMAQHQGKYPGRISVALLVISECDSASLDDCRLSVALKSVYVPHCAKQWCAPLRRYVLLRVAPRYYPSAVRGCARNRVLMCNR